MKHDEMNNLQISEYLRQLAINGCTYVRKKLIPENGD